MLSSLFSSDQFETEPRDLWATFNILQTSEANPSVAIPECSTRIVLCNSVPAGCTHIHERTVRVEAFRSEGGGKERRGTEQNKHGFTMLANLGIIAKQVKTTPWPGQWVTCP